MLSVPLSTYSRDRHRTLHAQPARIAPLPCGSCVWFPLAFAALGLGKTVGVPGTLAGKDNHTGLAQPARTVPLPCGSCMWFLLAFAALGLGKTVGVPGTLAGKDNHTGLAQTAGLSPRAMASRPDPESMALALIYLYTGRGSRFNDVRYTQMIKSLLR